MRFVTGDECGLLKESLPIARKEKLESTGGDVKVLTPIEDMHRSNGVVDMQWWSDDGQSFVSVLKDGRVRRLSVEHTKHDPKKPKHGVYKLLRECPKLYDNENEELALGLYRTKDKVCVCSSKGRMSVFDPEKFTDPNDCSVVQSFFAYDTPQNVNAHAASSEGLVAIGGKDRETVIWDVNHSKQVWKAKNLPPDPQTLLQQQVWPTAATFMNPDLLAIGSAYHQIRLYDIRLPSQRRPISYSPFDESLFAHRITALCPQNDAILMVGDSAGFLCALDIRMLRGGAILREAPHKAIAGRFVGPSGSIRQIKTENGKLACVGLDRMLRVFDLKSRRQIHEIYLKQRVNCLLMSTDREEPSHESDSDVDVEDKLEDYVGSSDDGDDDEEEDYANPFEDDADSESQPKKRRI